MAEPATSTEAPEDRRFRRVAEAAWRSLHEHGMLPTARNYDVLLRFHEGGPPELVRELGLLLDRQDAPSAAELDALHRRFVAPDDTEAVATGSRAIEREAKALADRIAGDRDGMVGYGEVLEHWSARLEQVSTLQTLVHAVGTLAAETAKASARNRTLEQELSASVQRIARLRSSLAGLRQRVSVDPLTGVANRHAFETRLKRHIAQAKRADAAPFCVLLFDVDHFKLFNDTHGHQTGDTVLRFVARLLSDNIGDADPVARYGGEEFVVLLPGVVAAEGARTAERVCSLLRRRRLVRRDTGQDVGQITMSVGVAQHVPGEGASALIGRADAALYDAKGRGRDRVATAPEPPTEPGTSRGDRPMAVSRPFGAATTSC